jgi:hypothetical protein
VAPPAPAPNLPDMTMPSAPAMPDLVSPTAAVPDLTSSGTTASNLANPPLPAAPTVPPAAAAVDDKLVADAVNDLIKGTTDASPTGTTAPAPPVMPEPTVITPAPAPPMPAAPAVPAPMSMPPAAEPAPMPPPMPAPVVAPAPTPPPMPPVPAAPATTNQDDDDSRPKKIIKPLDPATNAAPTDINELMAKEGHSLTDTPVQTHETPLPHQPGHVISPNPVSATGQPEDPSKISL